MPETRETVTRLLARLHGADEATRDEALQQVLELLYPEMRRLAARIMRRERPGHTLQPTALVHEAFLELVDETSLEWECRAHFMAVAARVMRRVLVDYARQRGRDKRGAGVSVSTLDENAIAPQPGVDVVALDEALERLAAMDPQQSRVVELRFFAGLSVEETAEALGVSPATVKRDWATAKLWLYNELMTR